VFITLYKKAYAANWVFQPLGTGTAILAAAIITAACVGVGPARFLGAVATTWRQSRFAILTVALIVGLAYLMNYSGMNYTLGLGVASAGCSFPCSRRSSGGSRCFCPAATPPAMRCSAICKWSPPSSWVLNPVLIAATNSSGGVMGKMISPQNIATGASVTHLQGQEGRVLARTFIHSIVLTILLGVLVVLQQYVFAWMIPVNLQRRRPAARRRRPTSAELERRLRRETRGEVLFDPAARGRYATDASIYQILPVGVFVPLDEGDVATAIDVARDLRVPCSPRGAGTSQCGQTVGAALVIDNSKHLRRILEVDLAARIAVVEPGSFSMS
jgi:hypothetical protein